MYPKTFLLYCSLCITATTVEASSFDPDISLIVDARLTHLEHGDVDRDLPGFFPSPEAGPGSDGPGLGEAELVVSEDFFGRAHGYLAVAIHYQDGQAELELEEAYLETLGLPGGLGLKVGRMFSHVGYQNLQHGHTWDFVDASLPQQALLGRNFGDAGLHLSWLAPTDLYLELGVEAFQGERFPAAGGVGSTRTVYLKLGGDLGVEQSWLAGIARLDAQARARENEHAHAAPGAEPGLAFSGDSDLEVLDLTWKWAPAGNWRQRNLSVTGAWYRRAEQGAVELELAIPETGSYVGRQRGYYLQAVYQFMPRWRLGLRVDQLSADNRVSGLSQATVLDDDTHSPRRISLMADFARTEYQRLRLQYTRADTERVTEDQLFLQYIISLGPHGAHRF